MALAGCGGGGGKGKPGSGSTTPAAPAAAPAPAGTVTVALSSAPVSKNLDYGDDFNTALDGTWSGSDLGHATVYLQVVDSGNLFTIPAVQPAPAGGTFHYTVSLPVNASGDRTGTLTVRACRDAACTQLFSNASASISYQVRIAAVGEWETLQRDATHNGYVPIRLDPARFAKAWEWTVWPQRASFGSSIGRPATGPGGVFFSLLYLNGSYYADTLVALDEATGNLNWAESLLTDNASAGSALSPAAAYGHVYSVIRGGNTLLTAFDATTGAVKFKYAQPSLPDAPVLAPTLFGGSAYFFAGPRGNEIHAADATTGVGHWSRARIGDLAATPAVGQDHVYYYASPTLEILDRATGNTIASLVDPASDGSRPPGSTAPVLGSRGNVIVNSYNATLRSRKLSSFNIANRLWEWSSDQDYQSLPAVAGGVIYAMRSSTSIPTLDAVDEATGHVLWSWSPPAADGQKYAINNVVATRNLVFVNTLGDNDPGYLWAIDLSTRQAVWRYPGSGYTAISANRTLYLVPDIHDQWAKLTAIKLR